MNIEKQIKRILGIDKETFWSFPGRYKIKAFKKLVKENKELTQKLISVKSCLKSLHVNIPPTKVLQNLETIMSNFESEV